MNGQRHINNILLVWVNIICESKMERKIYDLRKVDRIRIPQLARSRSKKQKETEI